MTKDSQNTGNTSQSLVRKIQGKSPDHENVINVVLYEQADLQESIRRKFIFAVVVGTTSTILYDTGTSVDETLGIVMASPPAMIAIVEAMRAVLHRIV